jgi:hypothetical protein
MAKGKPQGEWFTVWVGLEHAIVGFKYPPQEDQHGRTIQTTFNKYDIGPAELSTYQDVKEYPIAPGCIALVAKVDYKETRLYLWAFRDSAQHIADKIKGACVERADRDQKKRGIRSKGG